MIHTRTEKFTSSSLYLLQRKLVRLWMNDWRSFGVGCIKTVSIVRIYHVAANVEIYCTAVGSAIVPGWSIIVKSLLSFGIWDILIKMMCFMKSSQHQSNFSSTLKHQVTSAVFLSPRSCGKKRMSIILSRKMDQEWAGGAVPVDVQSLFFNLHLHSILFPNSRQSSQIPFA